MSVVRALEALERDLVAEAEHYHVPQLAKRFAGAYTGALVTSLAASGWHVAGWAALWSVLAGAGVAAWERVERSVPWSAVLAVVRDARDLADRPAPPPLAVDTPMLKAPSAPPGG